MPVQIILIPAPVTDTAVFRQQIELALSAAPISSIVLQGAGSDDKARMKLIEPLIAPLQDKGVAVIIAGDDPRLAVRCGADGFHMRYDAEAVDLALDTLQPDRMLGVGGLGNRDDAMAAGDMGADYLLFGEPRPDGSIPALSTVLERCRWWAEIFTTPCIGYAPDADTVPLIGATGCEFVALGAWAFEGDIAANLAQAAQLLASPSVPSKG